MRTKPTDRDKCAGWEVICPDGRVRDYPYHNEEDAVAMAEAKTQRRCRVWPEPSEVELEQPPCPEGHHTVRSIEFDCPGPRQVRAN